MFFLERVKATWDRFTRKDINDNFEKIEKNFNNVVDVVSKRAYNQVVDDAKLNWLEPVPTFADLRTAYPNARKGDTVMAREVVAGVTKSYRYNGTEWVWIQQLSADAVNEVDRRLSEQLAQTAGKVAVNAMYPLPIETYDGSGQTVHPDVEYISEGFAGVPFWMAHTPYPNTNDDFENPSIVSSFDGINFTTPTGLTNPIDQPTTQQHAQGLHMSDAVLVYRKDLLRLECWYRLSKDDGSFEQILRKTSTNGVNWSAREVVMDLSGQYLMFSPSLLFEDGVYKMWFVAQGKVWIVTSTTGAIGTWSARQEVRVNHKDRAYPFWHLDVFKDDDGKHILVHNSYDRHILIGESTDGGLTFNDTRLILSPAPYLSWDDNYIYRGSLTKYGGFYRLYYSAWSKTGQWHIGMIQGKMLDTMRYVDYKIDGYNFNKGFIADEFKMRSRGNKARLKHDELLFFTQGVGAVALRNRSADILRVENEAGTALANLHLSRLTADENVVTKILTLIASTANAAGTSYLTNSALQFFTAGIKGARLVNSEPNILSLLAPDSNSTHIQLKAASIEFSDGEVITREGVIRYNKTLKKYQGYDGMDWRHLNNFVTTIPNSSNASGQPGDFAADDNYLYVCRTVNRWMRFAKDAW